MFKNCLFVSALIFCSVNFSLHAKSETSFFEKADDLFKKNYIVFPGNEKLSEKVSALWEKNSHKIALCSVAAIISGSFVFRHASNAFVSKWRLDRDLINLYI
ncbi:hypothetical protein M1446_03590 [Candidatus Dependentiae bacterium]|nr:hypothetical protein [Candidatus Dependentiae bacterium]